MHGLFQCNVEFEVKFHLFVCDPKELYSLASQ